jgi:urocanate hydratase
MSLVALHNGGGVGIGKAINGGFGMVLDGSQRAGNIIASAMMWDVMGGVARRSWARNPGSVATSAEYNQNYRGKGHITLPFIADDSLVKNVVKDKIGQGKN